MIKAVIFDFFGVLVGRGFDETYRYLGGDPDSDRDFVNDLLGQANLGMVSHDDFRSSILSRLKISAEAYEKAILESELANKQLLEFIKSLRPNYKTAILSNANSGVIEQKLGLTNLEDFFDTTIASADVGLIKPQPEIYQMVADRLGVDCSQCVFVDDAIGNCQGAEAVGMKSILYKNFTQFKTGVDKLLTDADK